MSKNSVICIVAVVLILTVGYTFTHKPATTVGTDKVVSTNVPSGFEDIKEATEQPNMSREEKLEILAKGIRIIDGLISRGAIKSGLNATFYIQKQVWLAMPEKAAFATLCAAHYVVMQNGSVPMCTIYNMDNADEKFAELNSSGYTEY